MLYRVYPDRRSLPEKTTDVKRGALASVLIRNFLHTFACQAPR